MKDDDRNHSERTQTIYVRTIVSHTSRGSIFHQFMHDKFHNQKPSLTSNACQKNSSNRSIDFIRLG